MAYIALLWKARTIEKYRLQYEREKLNSIRITTTLNSKQSLCERWKVYNFQTRKRISSCFGKITPEGSAIRNFCYYLRTDQTFPNFFVKSVIGFVGGIALTYLCFLFFVLQLSISLIHATFMSSIIGTLLTLGLAFSYRIRCIVFLLLPQLFTRAGRNTITCYALVLILTGPATNTLRNSEVLSESMACGQEQIKTTVREINESVNKPFDSMKDSIKILIDRLQGVDAKVKMMLVTVQRSVMSLAHSLQSGVMWLDSMANRCHKDIGDPYSHCSNVLKESVLDCQTALGPRFLWLCNVAFIANITCKPASSTKSFCSMLDFVNKNIIGTVQSRLTTFTNRVKSLLNLEVNVHHTYTFSSNDSKTVNQVAAGIVTEIRNKADPFLTWLSLSSCVTSLFVLLIISRAKDYQHMYETRSRYDNCYITKHFRNIDFKRQKQGRDTILPLNRREKSKYIKTTSLRLVSSEKFHFYRIVVFMSITTFKLMIHMVADYSLYWVLVTIRYHGRFQSPLQLEKLNAHLNVTPAKGLLAKIFNAILSSLTEPLTSIPTSPVTCLPNPSPPDFQRYSQIGILILTLWFLALFEPYGLRLRHLIMGLYRPERAKARAVWLYNHILRNRGLVMKYARRKLHREYKYYTEERRTFRNWLNDHIPFCWLQELLGTCPGELRCLLCGTREHISRPDTKIIRCETPKCPGKYCAKCFSDIGQLCTICLSPVDYGDMSDVSLEKGSSDDDSDSEQCYRTGRQRQPSSSRNPDVCYDMPETDEDVPFLRKKEKKKRWFGFLRRKRKEPRENVEDINITQYDDYQSQMYALRLSLIFIIHATITRNKKPREGGIKFKNKIYGFYEKCSYDYASIINLNKYYVEIANSIVDNKTKRFGAITKRIQKDRKQNNYGDFDKISEDRNKNIVSTCSVLNNFRSRLNYFKFHLFKSNLQNDKSDYNVQSNPTLSTINSHLCLRKRRKKLISTTNNQSEESPVSLSICPTTSNGDSKHIIITRTENETAKTCIDKSYQIGITQLAKQNKQKRVRFLKNCSKDMQTNPNDSKLQNEDIDKKNQDHIKETDMHSEDAISGSKNFIARKLSNILCYNFQNTKINFGDRKPLVNHCHQDSVLMDNDTTNHKRRKKRVSLKENLRNKKRLNKEENEVTRNYRLSNFLYENDWINRQSNVDFRYKDRMTLDKVSASEKNVTPIVDGSYTEVKPKRNYLLKQASHLPIAMETHLVQSIQSYSSNHRKHESDIDVSTIRRKYQKRNTTLTVSTTSLDGCMSRSLKYFKSIGHDFGPDVLLDELSTPDYEQIRMDQVTQTFYKNAINEQVGVNNTKIVSSTENQTEETSEAYNNFKLPCKNFLTVKGKDNLQNCRCSHRLVETENDPICSRDAFKELQKAYKEMKLVNEKLRLENEKMKLNLMKKPPLKTRFVQYAFRNLFSEKQTEVSESLQRCNMPEVTNAAILAVPNVCNQKLGKNQLQNSRRITRNLSQMNKNVCRSCQCTDKVKKRQVATVATMVKHADDEKAATAEKCSCGVQCYTRTRNVGIWRRSHISTNQKSVGTMIILDLKPNTRTVATMIGKCANKTTADSAAVDLKTKRLSSKRQGWLLRKGKKRGQRGCSRESILSYQRSSSRSDGTKTDTTICSLATISYGDGDENTKKRRRRKTNVITKSNKSTITDIAKLFDISTMTSWFYPEINRKKTVDAKEGPGYIEQKTEKKMKNRGVLTEGRIVSFRSYAQIIPRDHDLDIMSPSRYLLESQKYYNELYSRKHVPYVGPTKIRKETRATTMEKMTHKVLQRREYKNRGVEAHYALIRNTSSKSIMARPEWTAARGDQNKSFVKQNTCLKKCGTKLAPRKSRNLRKFPDKSAIYKKNLDSKLSIRYLATNGVSEEDFSSIGTRSSY